MPYTVYFENLPTATSTTREVTVVDPFDTNLDIRTFRLGQIVFSHYTVPVPANRSYFTTRVALSDQASNIVADISAGIDVNTRAATWTLTAIDLNTGLEPLDPNFGLLPPDTTNAVGEGYVTYTIQPVGSAATGTVITNQAIITFESNAPIATPITTNTLDSVAPTSSVAPLPSVVLDTNFTVSWSGSDDANGTGIANYRIFAADNSGGYSVWYNTATNTNNVIVTSASYTGQPGHTYKFYSMASDFAGNVEAPHTNADTTVLVSSNHPPVVPPVPDQVANVGTGLNITNTISDAGASGSQIGVSLVGAPPGVSASVTGSNIVIHWVPNSFQAGTTNIVQLVITNNGVPPLTNTQTFLVSIPDYVQAGIGLTATRAGDAVCLPMNLFTSTGLTNVQFVVTVPATGFTNWSITLLSPALCGGTVSSLNATQLLVNLTTCSGSSLLVTNQPIAELCLNVGSAEPSQFVPIPITAVQAFRANSSQVSNTGGQNGRLVVVADKPLLDIQGGGTNDVFLTLYGIPNTTNTLLATSALGGTNTFQPVWQSLITNLINPLNISKGTNSQMFFRVVTPSQ
jgi:hypothetical protein